VFHREVFDNQDETRTLILLDADEIWQLALGRARRPAYVAGESN
jgi:hypothetical protein